MDNKDKQDKIEWTVRDWATLIIGIISIVIGVILVVGSCSGVIDEVAKVVSTYGGP